jgi:transcriptional regulator with XRE-family HTH domain
MARTDTHGHDVSQAIGWLLGRNILDKEMAAVLGMEPATYSRNKEAADFPSFEQLHTLAEHFEVSVRVLAVWYRFPGFGDDMLFLFSDEEMDQYVLLGGGSHPSLPPRPRWVTTEMRTAARTPARLRNLRVQPDKPGLDRA